MKNILFLLVTILSTSLAGAQEFIPTRDYYLVMDPPPSDDPYAPRTAGLYFGVIKAERLTDIPMEVPATLEGIRISILDHPGLEGISAIIRVEKNFLELCRNSISNYILQTTTGDYITLPMLFNSYCEENETVISYRFPNQPFGKANSIIKIETLSGSPASEAPLREQQTIVWKDDTFGSAGMISDNF